MLLFLQLLPLLLARLVMKFKGLLKELIPADVAGDAGRLLRLDILGFSAKFLQRVVIIL